MSRDLAIQQMIEAAKVMYHATGDSREWHQAHDALMYAVEEIQETENASELPPNRKEKPVAIDVRQVFLVAEIKCNGHLSIESRHYEDDEAHDVARLMARRIAAEGMRANIIVLNGYHGFQIDAKPATSTKSPPQAKE